MKVEAVMFANEAAIDNGLLVIQGGGWEHIDTPGYFPMGITGYVAGILTLGEDQHGSLLPVLLQVFDDSGQVEGFRASIIANGTRPKTVQGVPYRTPFAISFMTVASGPTVMKARLSDEGTELAVISVAIRGGAPDTPPADM